MDYSNHLNTGLVRYWNGQKFSGLQMVQYEWMNELFINLFSKTIIMRSNLVIYNVDITNVHA